MARKPAQPEHTERGDDTKSARTRRRILDAAAHVLSRKGYAGTRLTDVAEVAELQAPAIYYYYPSREDLIEEVMWTGIALMAEHVQEKLDTLPPDMSAIERIEVAVDTHLRYVLEISDYTTAAIRNAGQIPDNMRARYATEANRYGDIWRKLFREAKRDGTLRPGLDERTARMLVLGALNWAAEWWNPRRGSLEKMIGTAKSIIRAGLAAEPEPEQQPEPAPTGRRSRNTAKAAT